MLPTIPLASLTFTAHGLDRPECVLTNARGDIFASDRRGGVHWVKPNGEQSIIGSAPILPNGVALMQDGTFLVTNLSTEGGIWRVARDGTAAPYITEIEGRKLG